MPTFAGTLLPIAEGAVVDSLTSANLFLTRAYLDPYTLAELNTNLTVGTRTFASVTPHNPNRTGDDVPDFGNDWYFRIHVVPTELDLGNLVSAQQRTVSVWNAFFTPVNYSSLVTDGFDGISSLPPAGVTPPTTLAQFQFITYNVAISLNGPPTVDASMTFTIEGVEYRVPITGRRVVLMPFPPNWSNGVEDTLAYRTSISRSWDGTEQRMSLRAKPRRTLNYNVLLRSQDAQRLDNLIFGWHSRLYGVPLWAEPATLQAEVAEGGVVLTFDPSNKSFAAGGLVVVYADAKNYDVREVESIVGSTVTLRSPVTRTWPAGTRVYPVAVSALSNNVSVRRLTDGTVEAALAFETEPSSNAYPFAAGTAAQTYQGEELYAHDINWADGIDVAWDTDRGQIDYQTGKFQLLTKSGFSQQTVQHNWTLTSHAEVSDWRAWAQRREGRAFPVYMPSTLLDFTLALSALPGDTAIDVLANDYDLFVTQSPARRDIAIRLKSGTIIARRIVSSAMNVDGTLRLQLDSAVGVSLAPQDVKRISLLGFYRLASDQLTVRWLTEGKAQVEAALVATKT